MGPHLELGDIIFEADWKVEDHSIECFDLSNDLLLGVQQANTELLELKVRFILDVVLVQSSVRTITQHNVVGDYVYLLASEACLVDYVRGLCVHLD